MSKLIMYLLEASAILMVLYSLYFLVLRRLTFFSFNRFFLLAILVFSLIIPLLNFDLLPSADPVVIRPVAELSNMRLTYYHALDAWMFDSRIAGTAPQRVNPSYGSTLDMKQTALVILFTIYVIVVIGLLSRTLWTYVWMRKLQRRHPKEVIDGVLVVKVPYPIAPFSFMNAVFVHDQSLEDESFQQILAHERTHINQRHSIDLIFVQLIAAFLWFNPVVWQVIKSIKATHEYIVDKQMINQGYSLVEYQTLLLRQLISNNSYGLVHNFNLSFIKKRITMMKIKESGWAGKVKVAAVFAAVVVFSLVIVQCNAKLEESEVSVDSPSLIAPPPPPVDLPQINNVGNYKCDVDLSNSITFQIDNDVLRINGEISSLEDVEPALSGTTDQSVMILMVNKNQKMGMVRDLQEILRMNNRRKVLYKAIDEKGHALDMPILLSPHPDSPEGANWPKIDDEFAQRSGTEVLKVKVGDDKRQANTAIVSEMVKRHMANGDDKYVVSFKSEDSDVYGDFFTNLFYVQRGFDEIYEERSQQLYGKGFYEIDRKAPGGNEQYNAVRQGIPRAISIAERY